MEREECMSCISAREAGNRIVSDQETRQYGNGNTQSRDYTWDCIARHKYSLTIVSMSENRNKIVVGSMDKTVYAFSKLV